MECIGKFVHKMKERKEEENITWESGETIEVEKLGVSSGKSKSQKR